MEFRHDANNEISVLNTSKHAWKVADDSKELVSKHRQVRVHSILL